MHHSCQIFNQNAREHNHHQIHENYRYQIQSENQNQNRVERFHLTFHQIVYQVNVTLSSNISRT